MALNKILSDFVESHGFSLTTNGYMKLQSGLIVQWGTSGAMSGSPFATVNVTFPIAFPNAALACVAMSTGAGVSVSSNGPTLVNLSLVNSTTASSPAKWLAVGY